MKQTHEFDIPAEDYISMAQDIKITGWSDGQHLIEGDYGDDCVAVTTEQIPEVIAALAEIYIKETENE